MTAKIFFSLLFVLGLVACTGLGKRPGQTQDQVSGKTLAERERPVAAYSGHGTASVDPKTLAKFAPPPLDPEIARRIQNMLEITAPGMGVLTPDGRTMYFGWGVTGTPQVWKLGNPLGFPMQFTSGVDATSIVDITPDGTYLVIARDHAGEENPGLYLQSVNGGPLIEIQHKKDVRTSAVRVTKDARTLFYMANDIKPDSFALYSYRIASGQRELLFSEPGLWFVGDVDGDSRFLLGRMTGSLTREYFEWDLKERKLKPVIGQGEKEDYSVSFGASPGEYLVLTPKLGEFKRLYRLRGGGGKLEPLTPADAKMDVEDFRIDEPRRHVYLQWNDNGYTRLEVRDAKSFARLAIPELENAARAADHVYVGKISRDGRFITLGVESSLQPRTSYVYDWRAKKLAQWVRPSMPEIDASKFSPTTLESYPARDGTKIPMLVTRPAKCAADPCSVVVHFHGGPESQSRPGFNRVAQLFALEGIVFVEPNVRGSEGYGKSWLAADDGPRRLNVITDIEDCAKHIRSAWAKNGRSPRIGVMGWSYGGYSTLMAMSRFAGAYDAGVALVGMSNLTTFLMNTAPYRRVLRISEYGDPDRDREALEKLSPTTYLAQIKDPLMIIQGVSDPRVPVGEAIQMQELLQKKLQQRGLEAPLILFANEGHGSIQRSNKVLEIGHTLRFFKENL